MTREADVKAILIADAPLMALLTGGVFTDEEVGVEGIRRSLEPTDTNPTKDVFDADGVLQPCAVVRQRGETLYQNINLVSDQIQAVGQVVQIYYYEFRQAVIIHQAKQRVYELLMGVRVGGSYPVWRMAESPIFPDTGPVQNSTTAIQDWQIVFLRKPS